jgi:nicotinic acid mononucleotide adenylyltransferase
MTHTLVFGLSADPVHAGHVEMVIQSTLQLLDRGLEISQVLLVPVYRRNPVGAAKHWILDTYAARLTMCGLAAEEIARALGVERDRVRASAIEAELAGERSRPNYTAETLKLLKLRSAPGSDLIFLISSELVSGPDPQFGRWYRPDIILRLASLAICPRPGYERNARFVASMQRRGAEVLLLDEVDTPDISATEVRDLLGDGVSPLALAHYGILTPSIAAYLARHELYTIPQIS